MQYLLTEAEFSQLVAKDDLRTAKDTIRTMRRMIVPVGKCAHDADGPEYCDECPLSGLQSASAYEREQAKLMCGLVRNYSK
jgi:hypothetical protein